MEINYKEATAEIVAAYHPGDMAATADALQTLWLNAAEDKEVVGLTAADREALKAVGVPVAVLTAIGKAMGKVARKRVTDFIPLVRHLWADFGREGRIVALHALGPMELAAPQTVIPVVYEMACTIQAWEDCDTLAMRALEPIVRKDPEGWLPAIESWLDDENRWVRRAGVIVVGRLPMKHSAYTEHCLVLSERLLLDDDRDVKRGVSFAIRLSARGDVAPVRDFLARNVPPEDPAATWVLCDIIRSMAKKLLPEFLPVLPNYETWAADPSLGGQERRSIESAIKILRSVV